MEIKLSTTSIKAARTGDAAPKAARLPAADNGLSFPQSQALDARLQQLPDVRPEEVERGRTLVALAQYPPVEMMHKIARLLAVSTEETDSSALAQ